MPICLGAPGFGHEMTARFPKECVYAKRLLTIRKVMSVGVEVCHLLATCPKPLNKPPLPLTLLS